MNASCTAISVYNKKIVDSLLTNATIIDTHGGCNTEIKIKHIGFFVRNGVEHVVPLFQNCNGFSLNPLSITNDKVHLSTCSVGGVFSTKDVFVTDAVLLFNARSEKSKKEWNNDCGLITQVFAL